jgi:Mg2+/Co2+ transporter CorB
LNDIPLSTLALALIVLLVTAGFFSIAETAMMAANRYRLMHQAQRGARGARLAMSLLGQVDKLLGVILLGNTLVAAAAATLTAVIAKRLFGEGELALALGTLAISFALLVFSEITPKVVAPPCRPPRAPRELRAGADAARLADRLVVNLFVQVAAVFRSRHRCSRARCCRRKSCARWCSKARNTSAASTRRCSRT